MKRKQITNYPNLPCFQRSWKILLYIFFLSIPMSAHNNTVVKKKGNNRTTAPNVTRIDPTNWFADMQDPTL